MQHVVAFAQQVMATRRVPNTILFTRVGNKTHQSDGGPERQPRFHSTWLNDNVRNPSDGDEAYGARVVFSTAADMRRFYQRQLRDVDDGDLVAIVPDVQGSPLAQSARMMREAAENEGVAKILDDENQVQPLAELHLYTYESDHPDGPRWVEDIL